MNLYIHPTPNPQLISYLIPGSYCTSSSTLKKLSRIDRQLSDNRPIFHRISPSTPLTHEMNTLANGRSIDPHIKGYHPYFLYTWDIFQSFQLLSNNQLMKWISQGKLHRCIGGFPWVFNELNKVEKISIGTKHSK